MNLNDWEIMFTEHYLARTPEESVTVWRYMSIEKYLSLISTSKIFMCRLDKLDDKWEGVWPRRFHQALVSSCKAFGMDPSIVTTLQRTALFINCWHANEYESAAMWDLYGSKHSGVAIKTTVGNLKNCVLSGKDHMIGEVEYIDLETDPRTMDWNQIAPAFLKRNSFKHEHEVRLVIFDTGDPIQEGEGYRSGVPHDFLELSIDLTALISEVVLSPVMPEWLVSSLIAVSDKFGVDTNRITQSKLYDDYVI